METHKRRVNPKYALRLNQANLLQASPQRLPLRLVQLANGDHTVLKRAPLKDPEARQI